MRTLVLLLAVLLAGCSEPEPPLVASDVEITRPMPGMSMSAGFFVLTNNTNDALTITSVASPQFESVEVHETTIVDGVARMRKLDALVVPAKDSVALERGGKHLMLMRPVDLGDSVTLQLMSGDLLMLTIDYAFAVGEQDAR